MSKLNEYDIWQIFPDAAENRIFSYASAWEIPRRAKKKYSKTN